MLFVEEAQSMPIETLEEIRLLSNLETDENKLLQMVLFGQPELDEKLSAPNIRQLRERITHSFNLSPFPPDDTLDYLNFRLRAVGYKGPDIFNRKTAGVVKKYSDGLTRRINIIADKSMLAAFSEGSHTVTPSHIKTAARDSEFKSVDSNKTIIWVIAILFLLFAALALGIIIGQNSNDDAIAINRTAEIDNVGPGVTSNGRALAVPGDQHRDADTITANISTSDSVVSTAADKEMDVTTTGLIAERIEKTQQWLSSAADTNYSIQLFTARTSDADKVEAFLEDVPETLDFEKIFIYETVINGRAWFSVIYNDFTTQDEAIQTLEQLPSSLKASDPYLRRIYALKKDSTGN